MHRALRRNSNGRCLGRFSTRPLDLAITWTKLIGNLAMQINLHDVKTHLSRYVDQAWPGRRW